MTASLLKAHVGGLMRNRQGGRKMEGNEIPLYTRQCLMRSGGGGGCCLCCGLHTVGIVLRQTKALPLAGEVD